MGKMCVTLCDKNYICIISYFLQDSLKTVRLLIASHLQKIKHKLSSLTYKRLLVFCHTLLSLWKRMMCFQGLAVSGLGSPCPAVCRISLPGPGSLGPGSSAPRTAPVGTGGAWHPQDVSACVLRSLRGGVVTDPLRSRVT